MLKDVPDGLVGVVERRGADVGVQRVGDQLQVPTEKQRFEYFWKIINMPTVNLAIKGIVLK